MPPPASVLRSKLFKKTMLLADSSCFHEILWKWYFTKRVGIFAYKVSYSVYTYMILWYSLPSSNLKLAASSRLWAKMQGFSSYVVFFQKYTNVLIFWSRLYTGKIKTWKVQRGTSKMVLFYVKNLTVSLSLLWKANMQVFKVHKFDLTFSIVDG